MKNIVIGVTGGIACYKAAEVVNSLTQRGNNVQVIMTWHAQKFVAPLTFQILSKNRVLTDIFKDSDISHIDIAQKADIFAVVPATANIIGKIANGVADDLLTLTLMASKCRKIIAPAMNTLMWENPIVAENVEKLKKAGYEVLDIGTGLLACGVIGKGTLLPWETIVEVISN